MPLEFVGNSSLRFGGEGGRRVYFNTTERGWEARGAEGGIWRKNPLPRGPWSWQAYGPSFEPVCDEPAECALGHSMNPGGISPCKCSGSGVCALPGHNESNCADMPQMEVVDSVRIPAGLVPGEYVLGCVEGEAFALAPARLCLQLCDTSWQDKVPTLSCLCRCASVCLRLCVPICARWLRMCPRCPVPIRPFLAQDDS